MLEHCEIKKSEDRSQNTGDSRRTGNIGILEEWIKQEDRIQETE
jgi:hypothetical protein